MRNKNWIEFNNNKIKNEDIKNKEDFESQSRKIKIYREKKGKKGKTVTFISGFASQNPSEISELLKKLKIYCGTGGSLNKQGIQLQGDMEDKVKFFLRKEGYGI
tara:strand:- start:348 stop:659 length:312 start_codon:yes stop_codon:yes gene_type:complete